MNATQKRTKRVGVDETGRSEIWSPRPGRYAEDLTVGQTVRIGEDEWVVEEIDDVIHTQQWEPNWIYVTVSR